MGLDPVPPFCWVQGRNTEILRCGQNDLIGCIEVSVGVGVWEGGYRLTLSEMFRIGGEDTFRWR